MSCPTPAAAEKLPNGKASTTTSLTAPDKQSSGLSSICASLHTRITSFLSIDTEDPVVLATQAQARQSLLNIHDALDRYPLSSLSLSYNGGKDCLVLLLLFLAALHSNPATAKLPAQLPAVYIESAHPFAAVTSFVGTSAREYGLSIRRYSVPMREAFEAYLREVKEERAAQEGGGIEAIFVGTRRTDPHGWKLGLFQRTDGGWPDFVRILPVLEWKYEEIWTFIRRLEVPYCELYDQGFTSLGGMNDTRPNPALRVILNNNIEMYRPAYELKNGAEERLGRDS